MKFESKISLVDIDRKVFDIKNEPMPRGAWWWWFWLFFFNNPKTPQKPRQLMILWSTKNEREIDCNDVKLKIDPIKDRSNLCGVVAAWYFDGEKMHTFRDIDVFRNDKKITTFNISGENRNEKIKFVVNSYSHSSWTFKKKAFKMFTSKFVYNEYPAVISDLKLIDKKTGKIIPLSLGNSVGNAEHSTGFLL